MQDSSFEFADEQVLGEGHRIKKKSHKQTNKQTRKKKSSFFCGRGFMAGILESWSLQLRNDTKMSPQLKSFFFIVTSIVYADNQVNYDYMSSLLTAMTTASTPTTKKDT
jgi:hypothetical protein